MDDDYNRQMRQLLLDDAILYSGIEAATLMEGVDQILILSFPSSYRESVRKLIRTGLFAANRRESFALDAETAIPHLPLNDHEPVVGWFRSSNGLADPNDGARSIKVIFLAIAPDPILKHLVALACRILSDDLFRREFKDAATGQALRLALTTAFERQVARHVDTSAILEKRAGAVLAARAGRNSKGDVFIDYLLVENLRGIHARFSAKIAQCIDDYDCDTVIFSARGVSTEGRSIMGMMLLGLGPGHVVEVVIQGRQAKELGLRLTQLFAEEAVNDLTK
jgi:phosphocarrier protein HPr